MIINCLQKWINDQGGYDSHFTKRFGGYAIGIHDIKCGPNGHNVTNNYGTES